MNLASSTTSTRSGQVCNYTGTAGVNSMTMTGGTCTPNLIQLTCNGNPRDVYLASRTFTGTVNGSTIAGTTAEQWDVFARGDKNTNLGAFARPAASTCRSSRGVAKRARPPLASGVIIRTPMALMTLPSTRAFEDARARMAPHVYHTPLLTSRMLSERTGFDVRLKAELFQRTGSYKIRGPLNKFTLLSDEEKRRGVICSSAGNHAQGVALAARIHGINAVVCMAANATPSKIEATRAYGAEVVLHGIDLGRGEREGEAARRRARLHLHPSRSTTSS